MRVHGDTRSEAAVSGATLLYDVFGLRVQSEVPLPLTPAPSEDAAPDVVIRQRAGARPPAPDGPIVTSQTCPMHGQVMEAFRGPGGLWLWHQALGTFHVAADALTIDVYPIGEVDIRALGHALLQPILLYVLHARGYPSLHAGAIGTSSGAVAFIGRSGQGKSTLTATLLRHGASLLTDDALPLDERADAIYGIPGPPMMKLWRETAEHSLELDDELPDVMQHFEKKLLTLQGRYLTELSPTRLRAVYVLNRYDAEQVGHAEVAVHTLGRRDALAALLVCTSSRMFLRAVEEAPLLGLYSRLTAQVPVRLLSYPSGFAFQDAVCAQILADMEAV